MRERWAAHASTNVANALRVGSGLPKALTLPGQGTVPFAEMSEHASSAGSTACATTADAIKSNASMARTEVKASESSERRSVSGVTMRPPSSVHTKRGTASPTTLSRLSAVTIRYEVLVPHAPMMIATSIA